MKTLASSPSHTLRKWNLPLLAIVATLGVAICCSSALAQSGAGSIQGTVTDATGAVIPGASIHVVNDATSVAIDTKSNSVGFYLVPELFTGHYTVTVTAPNMKTNLASVELLVDQHAVIDPVLTAGAVTQQVQVAADMVQLTTTDNGTIASTLENSRINQLPMNGRALYTLAGESTPGLESSGQRANGLLQQALEYVFGRCAVDQSPIGFSDTGQPARSRFRAGSAHRNHQHQRPLRYPGHRGHHHQVGHQLPAWNLV